MLEQLVRRDPRAAVPRNMRRVRRTLVYATIVAIALFTYYVVLGMTCSTGCDAGLLQPALLIGHAALITGFGLLALRMARHDALMILSPMTGFLVSTALFFGFGSLSTFLADPITLNLSATGNYHIDATGLLRTDTLTMFGVMLVLAGMNLGSRLAFAPRPREDRPISVGMVATIFLSSGLVLKYGLLIPARWGMIDVVVPGALNNLLQLPDLGFMLAAYAMARGVPGMRTLFLLLWPPHLLLCLVEFSKTPVMFAVLLPALGGFLAHRRFRNVVPWLVCGAAFFAVSQNINTQARAAVIAWGGAEDQAPLLVRTGIMLDILTGRSPHSEAARPEDMAPQMWWMRLNYSGPQLRAMELHDLGDTAGWMVSPIMYLVPRFLWPDKPELVSPGLEFNRTVSHSETTIGRVATTIYGEGYWIAGWAGTAVLSLLTGLVLGTIGRSSYQLLSEGNLLYLPAAFIALNLGALGVNGFFQTNILGGLTIYVAYLLMVRVGLVLLPPNRAMARPAASGVRAR
jgi:hypothetical protein